MDDRDEDEENTLLESRGTTSLPPFIIPKYLHIGYPAALWTRDTLFNGERGEIGLAWSIFKIFGTPTKDSWPVSSPSSFLHH